jgi:hypothetical protein
MDSQTDPTVLAASRFPKFHHKHLEEVTLNQLDGHWSLICNQRVFPAFKYTCTKEKNPKNSDLTFQASADGSQTTDHRDQA